MSAAGLLGRNLVLKGSNIRVSYKTGLQPVVRRIRYYQNPLSAPSLLTRWWQHAAAAFHFRFSLLRLTLYRLQSLRKRRAPGKRRKTSLPFARFLQPRAKNVVVTSGVWRYRVQHVMQCLFKRNQVPFERDFVVERS